jgi:phosphoribosylformylglycinamidine synthase
LKCCTNLVTTLQIDESKQEAVVAELQAAGVQCNIVGRVTSNPHVSIAVDGEQVVSDTTASLRDVWEETSFSLEKLQRLEACVEAEQEGLKHRETPAWKLSFTPSRTSENLLSSPSKPKVAIIREEGSNGDREMSAMVLAAGFEPWDVAMSDLLQERASLTDYRGLVFVGGFSYADVLDSAKGWAGTIRFNNSLLEQVKIVLFCYFNPSHFCYFMPL